MIARTELPREGSRFAARGRTTSRAFPDGWVISATVEGIFEWESKTGLLRLAPRDEHGRRTLRGRGFAARHRLVCRRRCDQPLA